MQAHRFHIPVRFFAQIRSHLIANFADLPLRPSIMGVFGPPGEGKSLQLERSIERCNVEVLWVNAGDLESDNAGEPARVLVEVLKSASTATATGEPTAVVLHDVDTTLGEWKNNTGTVNHQHLIAELMHLADRPAAPRFGGVRVPVFVTGNDSTKLYAPLTRARRMTLFSWLPTEIERAEVVNSLFRRSPSDPFGLNLVEQFEGEAIAFYADVLSRMDEDLFIGQLADMPNDMREVMDSARALRERVEAVGRPFSLEVTVEAARALAAERSGALTNFIKEVTCEP